MDDVSKLGRPRLLQAEAVLAYWWLSIPAQAEALGVSVATIKRQWKLLREQGVVDEKDPRRPRRGSAGRARQAVPTDLQLT